MKKIILGSTLLAISAFSIAQPQINESSLFIEAYTLQAELQKIVDNKNTSFYHPSEKDLIEGHIKALESYSQSYSHNFIAKHVLASLVEDGKKLLKNYKLN